MGEFKVSQWDADEAGSKLCQDFLKFSNKKPKATNNSSIKKKKTKQKIKMKLKQTIPQETSNGLTNKKNPRKTQVVQNEELTPTSKNNRKKRKRQLQLKEPPKDNVYTNKQTNNRKEIVENRKFKRQKVEQNVSLANKLTANKMKNLSLRERMTARLKAAKFRLLNEEMYSSSGGNAQKLFTKDTDAFKSYHEGYRQQVEHWPINPVDLIIKSIKKLPKTHVIADFGCGEAKLAQSVQQTVHSFDLVALNDHVTACNMAHVELESNSVDVSVFCLSLMGTNLQDYFLEANRVLIKGGLLKIAEVESRFEDLEEFIKNVERFGFKLKWKDLSRKIFYLFDFLKENDVKNKNKMPNINLRPCLYKKR